MAPSHDTTAGIASSRPLRVAMLVKQVPAAESLTLGTDGRLRREGLVLEMNPYCRRAVAKGVAIATVSGGESVVFTMGPPSAEDVLREAIAWGATRAIHLCDPVLAGADTLATARALVDALKMEGPFDLVLVGRNSTDGETGQVGPEIAELLDLAFASGVKELLLSEETLRLTLEHDDGSEVVELTLPALLSVAERLCDPCKVDPAGRAAVAGSRITRLGVDDLGAGPFGVAGSPTWVGEVRSQVHERAMKVLSGSVSDQAREAVLLLDGRGALDADAPRDTTPPTSATPLSAPSTSSSEVVVLIEPDRAGVAAELLGAARDLAHEIGAKVVGFYSKGRPGADPATLCALGADALVELDDDGTSAPEDIAAALARYIDEAAPWAVLAPSTAWGREVAARAAAAAGAGLIGDAVGMHVVDGRLIAAKPAFAGSLVADVGARSATTLVTLRPGVLTPARPDPRRPSASRTSRPLPRRGRVRSLEARRDDDVELLARASAVVGVGVGVDPDDYHLLEPLLGRLGAQLAATRRVTDKGHVPRARQIGITGRAIAPRLYVAIGLSGKFNHMVGVRAAGTVLAINSDPEALVFAHADIGIVGDWQEAVAAFESALAARGSAR